MARQGRNQAADPQLKSKARQRLLAHYRQIPSTCHLCGNPIPMDVDPQRHRLSFTLDELHPRSLGGSATDPANLAPAHRVCNSTRGNRPLGSQVFTDCQQAIAPHLTTQHAASRRW